MTILEIKQYLNEKNITYKQFSILSTVSESTLKNIFSGQTKYPRIDTMNLIEKGLEKIGATKEEKNAQLNEQAIDTKKEILTDDELKILEIYRILTPATKEQLLTVAKAFAGIKENQSTNKNTL